MPPLTPARSGLMRSGDGRSGWPILAGVRAPLYALSNVARSGATRSNFHSGQAFVSIAGVQYGTGRDGDGRIPFESMSIVDLMNSEPTTASCTGLRFDPVEGQEVIVTLGSRNNLMREFGGYILRRRRFALTSDEDNTDTIADALSLIDYTWRLNKYTTVTGYFTGSATTIAETLIATYAPGFTAAIEQGLPTVTGGITFTNQTLVSALTQLFERIGGRWFCDYDKVIRGFITNTHGTPPTILNAVHPTLQKLSVSYDISQFLSRVNVEGGGVMAFATCQPGETLIPLNGDPAWYDTAGGVVKSGPQYITYTGVDVGGPGGLVGPGAAPSGPVSAALASGSGIESGAHSYAATFVTASGESLPSPATAITVGVVTAPTAAPTLGTPTIGSGPDPGSHDYAVTFVTASGETTASPLATKATTLTPAPTDYPDPGAATIGGSVDAGLHDYAVSFVTAIGETTPSPISGAVSTGVTSPPGSAPTPGAATASGSVDPGSHNYAVTFVTSVGETTPSPIGSGATGLTAAPVSAPTPGTPTTGGSVDAGSHDYVVTHVTAVGETAPSAISGAVATSTESTTPAVFQDTSSPHSGRWNPGDLLHFVVTINNGGGETVVGNTHEITAIDAGPPGSVANIDLTNTPTGASRRVYRSINGGGWRFATDALVGGSSTVTNTNFNGTVGTPPSTTPYVGPQTVPLSGIPTGSADVTSRKVYRRFNGAGDFKLVTTIANNVATTYTDTTANSGLGAVAPTISTAYLQTIPLTTIPTGDANVTARKLYRQFNGSGDFKLLTTIGNNFATTYTDTTANSGLGAVAPTSNTATLQTIPLTGIPLGDANVTARKIYRRSGGLGLKLLTTIANNIATTFSDTIANASLGAAPLAVSTAYLQRIPLTAIPLGGPLVTARKIYRTAAGGAQLKLAQTLADNTTTAWTDTVTDAGLGANVPVVNTAAANQVSLSGIPIGAAAVTARKLYRTAAGGSQLKLLATIADNVTSTYTDSTADGSLGANVPTLDTSGLGQPEGQVPAGSVEIVVAGTGAFRSSGGWAVIGNGQQVIRYTGKTGALLTGIPATGPGSIEAAIGYNSTITAAPMLTGVPASGAGAILYPILKGDDINIWETVTDTAAQAVLAALLRGGDDGIQEANIQDRRLAKAEARARAQARLSLHNTVEVGIRYFCRDINTSAGSTVPVNIGPPFNVTADFLIQSVTQTFQLTKPTLPPLYQVEASSNRLTFEQLLQMARTQ